MHLPNNDLAVAHNAALPVPPTQTFDKLCLLMLLVALSVWLFRLEHLLAGMSLSAAAITRHLARYAPSVLYAMSGVAWNIAVCGFAVLLGPTLPGRTPLQICRAGSVAQFGLCWGFLLTAALEMMPS